MFSFLRLFRRRKGYEYLYFYILNTHIYGESELNSLRIEVHKMIKNDCNKYNKNIVDYDFYTPKNNSSYFSSFIMCTDKIDHNINIKPLLYEIYAFMKKENDENVFSYPFSQLRIKYKSKQDDKILSIFKFKIKCY